MPNQQLIEYITQSIAQGVSKEDIKAALLGAGWKEADIDEGFLTMFTEPMPQKVVVKKNIPYNAKVCFILLFLGFLAILFSLGFLGMVLSG